MMMMMMMMKAGDDDDADGGDDSDDADDGDGDDDDDNDDDDGDDDDDDDDDNHDQPKTRTHFVRACAVEMHVHMSQATSEEPLYTEIVRKNAAAQNVLRTQPPILCEPAQSNRMSKFHKSHFILKFTGKMPGPKLSTLIQHRP